MRKAILIHGTASSSAHTWARGGWFDLLEDADIDAVPFALPGHEGSELPANASLDAVIDAVLATAPESTVLIGFSAGAALALHAALAAKERITTLILLGIGDAFWDSTSSNRDAAERMRRGATGAFTWLLTRAALAAGNTLEDVATYIETAPGPPPMAGLAALSARTLVVCGNDDPAGPVIRLAAALPKASVLTPTGLDHFRTTSSPEVMAAVMRFLR